MSVESCCDTMADLGCKWAWDADETYARLTIVQGPEELLGLIEEDTMADCARKFHDLHAAAIENRAGRELDPVLSPGQPGDLMKTLLRTMAVPS